MSAVTNGGPVFPVNTRSDGDLDNGAFGHQSGPSLWQFAGLTKRELFAAMAMQGFCADPSCHQLFADPEEMAENAVGCADALLAELTKAQP